MMTIRMALGVAVLAAAVAAPAAEKAPRETVSAMVGGKKVTVEYGRPLKPHGWQPWTNQELLRIMMAQVERNATRQ